jgi:hypothetical protein
MKNLLYLVFIILFALPESAEAKNIDASQTQQFDVLKRKKGYRRKRGFLWGIFRKRSQCDCPKN